MVLIIWDIVGTAQDTRYLTRSRKAGPGMTSYWRTDAFHTNFSVMPPENIISL